MHKDPITYLILIPFLAYGSLLIYILIGNRLDKKSKWAPDRSKTSLQSLKGKGSGKADPPKKKADNMINKVEEVEDLPSIPIFFASSYGTDDMREDEK